MNAFEFAFHDVVAAAAEAVARAAGAHRRDKAESARLGRLVGSYCLDRVFELQEAATIGEQRRIARRARARRSELLEHFDRRNDHRASRVDGLALEREYEENQEALDSIIPRGRDARNIRRREILDYLRTKHPNLESRHLARAAELPAAGVALLLVAAKWGLSEEYVRKRIGRVRRIRRKRGTPISPD